MTAGPMKHRLIATEEAFAVPEQVELMRQLAGSAWDDPDLDMWRSFLGAEARLNALLDVGADRLADMDRAGIDMQVLSLTAPGVQMLAPDPAADLAMLANDRLAETIARHPARFAGLASFAPQHPARAIREIERAITGLKLNGLIVNSHTNGEYLDNRKSWPILEAAAALDAALYIHPRNLPAAAGQYLKADIDLWGALWGFQIEVGLHAMRLIVSGVFDQFPKLKIVLGHLGEAVPFWLYRIDYMYRSYTRGVGKLKRRPSDYVRDNFVVTTSGMNAHPALKYCHEVLGPGNIMFAIDYPYQESAEAAAFMRTAPLPDADIAMIAHGNAERLFRIPALQPPGPVSVA